MLNRSNVYFTPNAKFVIAATLDSTIRLWDYQSDQTLKAYTGHTNRKYCIPSALTSTGKYLVAGSEDGKLIIWDVQTREIVQEVTGQKGRDDYLLQTLSWRLTAVAHLQMLR